MKHKTFILFLIIGVALLFSAGCKKNKPPETPDKPSGLTTVAKNATNPYTTKAHDPNNDKIRYIFDWGDNIIDTTTDYESDSTATATHSWDSIGHYVVKVQAQDEKDALSKEWSDTLGVDVIPNNAPNKPLTPIGPPYKLPNTQVSFKTLVTDVDGDSVAVKFLWGDGRTPAWTSFYASGDSIKDTITYTDTGTYSIRVIAKDKYGSISDTSDAFQFHVTNAWSFITGEDFNSSPALVTSGNSVTAIVVGCSDGYVYCMDTLGGLKWQYTGATGGSFNSSPAIGTDGVIYIGDEDGYVHAINPNGTQKWLFNVPGGNDFHSSPAINAAGDIIYIGCMNDTLYALSTDGSPIWTYGAINEISSSPAIANDGAIIFGDEGDTGRVYILNTDGTERHVFLADGPIYSSPAISGSTIYFAASDTLFYAIDTNGTQLNTYLPEVRVEVLSSPSIGLNGIIYYSDTDGRLYALNSNLTPVGGNWPYLATSGISSSVAVDADGLVYFIDEDDYLYAVNSNATDVWKVKLSATKSGKQEPLKPSPVIGPNGWIYAASEDGIYAFYRGTTLATTAWPMFRHDIRHTGKAGAKK
jgi:hypothetical protein